MNLTSRGCQLDTSARAFGVLQDATPFAQDGPRLRAALRNDGYLFIRNLIDSRSLSPLYSRILQKLQRLNLLEENAPISLSPPLPRTEADFYVVLDDLSTCSEGRQLMCDSMLKTMLDRVFGEETKSVDYIWPRAVAPGRAAPPHCDWVYMNRGSRNIISAWVPLMDVPQACGPIMILEDSHQESAHTRRYLQMDADRLGLLDGLRIKHGTLIRGGRYSTRPDRVRSEFSTRWLTRDFRVGDVLLFSPTLVHASLDNHSTSVRVSADMRFQPAREEVDPRFSGPNPVGHADRDFSIFDSGIYRFLRAFIRRREKPTIEH